MCKINYGFISIVHSHSNSTSFKIIYLMFCHNSLLVCKYHFQFSWLTNQKISGLILITKCMSSYDYWLFPSRYQTWNIFYYNWLSKHCTIQYIPNGTIWRFPHSLQFKFFNSGFIWSTTIFSILHSCTFNSNLVFLNCICCLNCHLIICLISILHS